jgi:hypothetical protein
LKHLHISNRIWLAQLGFLKATDICAFHGCLIVIGK